MISLIDFYKNVYSSNYTSTYLENHTTLTYEKLMACYEDLKKFRPVIEAVRIMTNMYLLKKVYTKPLNRKRRNKRWVKKWDKKYSTMSPSDEIYRIKMGNQIIYICHPMMLNGLKNRLLVKKVPETVKVLDDKYQNYAPIGNLGILGGINIIS